MTESKTTTIRAIDRAVTHFQPLRSIAKKIHIPEWAEEGDEGVYYATALNLKERQVIDKMSKDDIELGVEVIIRKLETEDGEKAFNRGDKQKMMTKVDPRVVARVAAEIIGENLELDDAEKN